MCTEIDKTENKTRATHDERKGLELDLQQTGYDISMKSKDIAKFEKKNSALLTKQRDYESEIHNLSQLNNGLGMDKDELDYKVQNLQKEREKLIDEVLKTR